MKHRNFHTIYDKGSISRECSWVGLVFFLGQATINSFAGIPDSSFPEGDIPTLGPGKPVIPASIRLLNTSALTYCVNGPSPQSSPAKLCDLQTRGQQYWWQSQAHHFSATSCIFRYPFVMTTVLRLQSFHSQKSDILKPGLFKPSTVKVFHRVFKNGVLTPPYPPKLAEI